MTEFSEKIITSCDLCTYEDVKNAYEHINNSVSRVIKDFKIGFRINYYLGNISCTSNSFDDFTKYAYGASEIRISNFAIYVHQKKEDLKCIIIMHYPNEISVSVDDDKNLLSKLVESIRREPTKDDGSNIIYNAPVHNNVETTIINNENGKISINKSNIGKNIKANDSKNKNDFFRNILENITTNLIWYIISAIVVALSGYGIFNFFNNK